MTGGQRKRVVIIGGGFAGIYTAMALDRLLKDSDHVEIILINRENYFVFQPMLPDVILGSISIMHTVTPIRRLCPRATLYTREAQTIDLDEKVIVTSPGVRPKPSMIHYDYLVLAPGTTTDFSGSPGFQEHAFPFKNLGDAVALRNHLLYTLEEANIEEDQALRRQLLTYVIIGGGFSGVEVAAAMNDFLRQAARNYKQIMPKEIRTILINRGTRILPEMSEGLASYAHTLLQRKGMEIRLKTATEGATAEALYLSDGSKLPTRTLVSTVPAGVHPLMMALPVAKDKRGRVIVNEYLEVLGQPGVWALGDCAFIRNRINGEDCPPTAQFAVREAEYAAKNIYLTIRGNGNKMAPFAFPGFGKLSSLGHYSAVAEVMGIKFSGILAWLVWRTVYLMKLPGIDRKLRVGLDWLLDILIPPDIVQLKILPPQSFASERFEAGDTIIQQGDIGDRMYIITEGEVEVSKKDSAERQTVLATLGPGEYFGEMALLSKQPRSATVRGRTKGTLVGVKRADFAALLAYFPDLYERFQNLAEQRLNTIKHKNVP
ncbi:MAG: FAD-dependent oxidoreductase [Nitrospirae bacterium]|nr:FAD-dependent oxidoreductase [Candidatus Troglogloeales bacterium]